MGFFEVALPSDDMDFDTFKNRVLVQNGRRTFEKDQSLHGYEYSTVDGTKIVFAGGYISPNVILWIGNRQEASEDAKPLAQGDIVSFPFWLTGES